MTADSEAILDIVEGRYFLAVWFVAGAGMDFLGAVFRDAGEKRFHLKYRFRYYRDDKAFDSDDEKSVYHATTDNASEAELEAHLDFVTKSLLAAGMPGPAYKVPLKTSDPQTIMTAIADAPFAYVKAVGAEA